MGNEATITLRDAPKRRRYELADGGTVIGKAKGRPPVLLLLDLASLRSGKDADLAHRSGGEVFGAIPLPLMFDLVP